MPDDSEIGRENHEEERLSEDTRRIQQVLGDINRPGMTQADRIMDRINQIDKTIENTNTISKRTESGLSELLDSFGELQSTNQSIEAGLNELNETLEQRFTQMDTKLGEIYDRAGLHIPEGTRQLITVPAGIALIAFSIISLVVAIVDGSPISFGTRISAAGGLGLLIYEILLLFILDEE